MKTVSEFTEELYEMINNPSHYERRSFIKSALGLRDAEVREEFRIAVRRELKDSGLEGALGIPSLQSPHMPNPSEGALWAALKIRHLIIMDRKGVPITTQYARIIDEEMGK